MSNMRSVSPGSQYAGACEGTALLREQNALSQLSPKARAAWLNIKEFSKRNNGQMPSVRQVAQSVKATSPSYGHELLRQMEAANLIERTADGGARGYSIVDAIFLLPEEVELLPILDQLLCLLLMRGRIDSRMDVGALEQALQRLVTEFGAGEGAVKFAKAEVW